MADVKELVAFLKSRQGLFSSPNSDFFKKRLYERIQGDVVAFMKTVGFDEMKRIPECYTEKKNCPPELKEFFVNASRFSILGEPSTSQDPLPCVIKSVKPKKAYEISRFVDGVRPLCSKHGIARIVDIGCGIGHLLRAFNASGSAFELVGIECNVDFVKTGKKMSDDIEFINVLLSKDTPQEELDRIFGPSEHKTAIVSLHGCGDLQPFLIELFTRLPRERFPLLATIACCYHKMSPESFPMKRELDFELGKPALRLACEQRLKKLEIYGEEDHQKQAFALISKGIVECFYERMGIDITSKPRGFCRNLGEDIPTILATILARNDVPETEAATWKAAFNALLEEHEESFDFVQHFIILQLALQPALESLILSDRLQEPRLRAF
ncbi:hypothetical protein L596_013724 [Steinernema carpocapsae]|uniref:Methyltransferase domain-containing protein n=1 Tax=Steinernema carpocapsae TaxID=34508 RepID=A0A4V6A566_STECR|nr:hypothetical protein L596_013724 [Steinernema carpocapsae]